ncbi:uncharacterized protein LOC116993634 [Catharus ustulatus]|uniref:uncharacterized protein LOC116993634 n=1 Tax=Catharus ustulatus TaxID=91951 RepID=UPI001409BABC|nr:uncharacterized protein LOC116993634 [Catharus ustulatus]
MRNAACARIQLREHGQRLKPACLGFASHAARRFLVLAFKGQPEGWVAHPPPCPSKRRIREKIPDRLPRPSRVAPGTKNGNKDAPGPGRRARKKGAPPPGTRFSGVVTARQKSESGPQGGRKGLGSLLRGFPTATPSPFHRGAEAPVARSHETKGQERKLQILFKRQRKEMSSKKKKKKGKSSLKGAICPRTWQPGQLAVFTNPPDGNEVLAADGITEVCESQD